MPCREYETTVSPEITGELEALLCAIFRALEVRDGTIIPTLKSIDWYEAGVSFGWTLEWWEEHQKKDAERIAAAREAKAREKLRQSALRKLTLAEREALNLTR